MQTHESFWNMMSLFSKIHRVFAGVFPSGIRETFGVVLGKRIEIRGFDR